jgi:hypothetical protein
MKNLQFICLLILMSFCGIKAGAQSADSSKVDFVYDVRFDMDFDNREFARNKFSPSMTIFGARLTPSVGVSVKQSGGISHKVMLGVDAMKNFGAPDDSTLKEEVTLYYILEKKADKTAFSLQAGVFPRSSMEAYYSEAFFSDSLKFYDNNLEGVLLKLRRPKAYFELGCDWMGQYSRNNRERFMVFSGGSGKIFPFLEYGYSAYMYHYANSGKVKGVVDNFLLNPYIRFDFADMTGLQALSLRAGWLQTMQNDRKNLGHYMFSGGADVELDVRCWNFGVRNNFYFGKTLMPLYHIKDTSGMSYSNNLYFGDPFFRVNDDGTYGAGFYNRAEAYYSLNLNDYLKLRATAAFHFNHTGYLGCQQMLRLVFDLQELLSK